MSNDISKITAVSLAPLPKESKNIPTGFARQTDNEADKSVTNKKEDKNNLSSKIISLDEAKKLAEQGNKLLEDVQRNLQFKVDEGTNQVVMSIVDKNTGKVIRQVPSEDMLALAKRMMEANGKPGALLHGQA